MWRAFGFVTATSLASVALVWALAEVQTRSCGSEIVQTWVDGSGRVIASIAVKARDREWHNLDFSRRMSEVAEKPRLDFEWVYCGGGNAVMRSHALAGMR
jgi:hypothetical protein